MTSSLPRTAVYIDGFNLYYSIRRTPNKWLDLAALCDRVLPNHRVDRVRYFTARVRPVDDAQQPQRQQAYLRALATTPRVVLHFGQFTVNTHTLRLSQNGNNELQFLNGGVPGTKVPVLKFEEKGSDVNLATYLLIDAHSGQYDAFAVLTNDTDLVEPIQHVSETLGLSVTLMNARARPAKRLVAAGNRFTLLTEADFGACQLEDPVRDSKGSIHKPPKWNTPPY